MSNPGKKHCEAVKHIFRYLRGRENLQLTFRSGYPIELEGFTDCDHVGNPDNRKSASSYVFTYGGGAISWRLKLHGYTTLSTTEIEYIVASDAAKEAIWLHCMSSDFLVKNRNDHPTPTLYCHSQSAIHLIRNPVYHDKTKHIEVWYHHTWELVTDKQLDIEKVDTEVETSRSKESGQPEGWRGSWVRGDQKDMRRFRVEWNRKPINGPLGSTKTNAEEKPIT